MDNPLNAAFAQCAAAGMPLSDRQKAILQQILQPHLRADATANPLAELTDDERSQFLAFVRQQTMLERPWKATLLNDWLAGQDSGAVQFIRDRYGVAWLERVQPEHLAVYRDPNDQSIRLQVGDRIEVTNRLWEWVQTDGPCQPEWFPCTVIRLNDTESEQQTSCVVRFETGAEYEITAIYDWNRPNWRWLASTNDRQP